MRNALLLVAGTLALASAGLGVFGPAYYAPESILDYTAVVLLTSVLLVTGVALLELFLNPLLRWGALAAPLSGGRCDCGGIGEPVGGRVQC